MRSNSPEFKGGNLSAKKAEANDKPHKRVMNH
jgi:hypothetical protein